MIDLKKIKWLLIEPTSFCNLHCPQCNRFNVDGYLNSNFSPAHLDLDLLEKNLDLNLLPSLTHIRFEGEHGDVMLHPTPTKILDIFSQHQIHLVTNGSMRAPKFWKELAKYQNLTVTFSIDGLQDTNHIYRINSNWEVIMANATAFIQAGGKAIWKFIAFEHNQHQIEQARELSTQLGFIEFVEQHSDRSWYNGDTWPVKVNGVFQYNLRPSSKVRLQFGASVTPRMGGKLLLRQGKNTVTATEGEKKFIKVMSTNLTGLIDQCHPRQEDVRSLYINHLGHLLPCCMTAGLTWTDDIQGKLWRKLVGNLDAINLTKTSLIDIINGEFYTKNLPNSLQSDRPSPVCLAHCHKNK